MSTASGLASAQGQVTHRVSVPYSEIKRRQDNATSIAGSSLAYPGGADLLNQRYTKNDLLIGRIGEIVHSAGRPQTTAVPSLNGLSLGEYRSLFDAQRHHQLIGVNKTDYDPADPLAPKSGLAVITNGTATIPYTGTESAFPGDKLRWRLPPLEEAAQEIPQWEGKPKGKIPVGMSVLNFDDIDQMEHLLVYLAMQPASEDGVADVDLRDPNIDSEKQAAILLKKHAMSSALYIIHGLVKKGLLRIMTPELQASIAGEAGAAMNEAELRNILRVPKAGELLTDPLDPSKQNDSAAVKPLYQIVQGNTQGGITQAERTTLIKDIEKSTDRDLLWLAGVLGVVPSPAVPQSLPLQNTVLKNLYPNSTSYNPMMGRPSSGPQLVANYFGDSSFGKKQAKKYQMSARDFQVEYRIVFAELMNSITRTVFATAYSHQVKGANKKIDINLGEK
jgi:hypothetical protein